MAVQKKVVDDPKSDHFSPKGSVEHEPQRQEEAKLLKQVSEASREADLEARSKLEKELDEEVKLARPEVDIPKDVSEHGVKSRDRDASQILVSGSTITLPVTEDAYKKGESEKFSAKDVGHREYVGTNSVAAMALWVGRILKIWHGKTMKVVFRK